MRLITRRLNEMYIELIDSGALLDGFDYAYIMTQEKYSKFRQETIVLMDINKKAPVFNSLPIFIDNSLEGEGIEIRKIRRKE